MATKKKTSAAPAQTSDGGRFRDPNERVVTIELTRKAIERHWLPFPRGAREFITETPDEHGLTGVPALIDFWSSPQNLPCTRGPVAECTCRASWYLAFVYLKLDMIRESRSLIMNGSFLHQCRESTIEHVCSASEFGAKIPWHSFPYFRSGVDALRSPEEMESFLMGHLPVEHMQFMTSYGNLADRNYAMNYRDQISDDWNAASSAPKKGHRRSSPNDDETRIELILVDDSDGGNRYSFDVGSSTILKGLFNEYADKRGVSLRSLRFSYMGKTLFLSNAGRKTPKELDLRDKDVILVHHAARSNPSDDDNPGRRQATPKKTKGQKKSTNKKSKAKRNGKKQQQRGGSSKTLEEYRVEHSRRLTKIHGEAQDRFKLIRQRLNNLVIERSQPKVRSRSPKPKDAPPPPSAVDNPFDGGLVGKAGRSRYAIQVGEVNNLYRTTKPSAIASSRNGPSSDVSSTLDLHGCTREEALVRLDNALGTWVDAAMRGPYPFVLPATIICGRGNQVLSEVVQEWIRSNDRVSNALKVGSSKRRSI